MAAVFEESPDNATACIVGIGNKIAGADIQTIDHVTKFSRKCPFVTIREDNPLMDTSHQWYGEK